MIDESDLAAKIFLLQLEANMANPRGPAAWPDDQGVKDLIKSSFWVAHQVVKEDCDRMDAIDAKLEAARVVVGFWVAHQVVKEDCDRMDAIDAKLEAAKAEADERNRAINAHAAFFRRK